MMSSPESIDTELTAILSNNPWCEMAKMVRAALSEDTLQEERFVLKQDDSIVRVVESLVQDDGYKLRLNLPPQPFIGHPKAKIWILQYNPGYSEGIDDFDYRGVLMPGLASKRRNPSPSYLKDRIGLLCGQYEFSDNVGFYVLDERFRTFKHGTRKGKGAYLWYDSTFFPSEGLFSCIGDSKKDQKRFADDNLFVIEFMPYHSQKFRHEFFPFLASFTFWKKLMHYAFTHDKIVLCHGLSDGNSLKTLALQSVPGYQDAEAKGLICRIRRSGKGRSRLLLKRGLVSSKDGMLRVDTFLDIVGAVR